MSLITKFLTRRSYRKQIKNFPKLIDVVMSCETKEQYETAMSYLSLYKNFSSFQSPDRGMIHYVILGRVFSYIQDNIEHLERGFHKPEWNDYKTVRYHPDLNDYFKNFFNVKFKKVWTRGQPSVYKL